MGLGEKAKERGVKRLDRELLNEVAETIEPSVRSRPVAIDKNLAGSQSAIRPCCHSDKSRPKQWLQRCPLWNDIDAKTSAVSKKHFIWLEKAWTLQAHRSIAEKFLLGHSRLSLAV
ncbi:hypothetical protein CT0861_07883 [Colletotrichum tofieldiae]|uniref:Transposase n=1 Tax=Colletotrichum tofieldiae TaxID=708197 RepID=A0A166YZA5_9PEZI|nr:hypothetical protein CT0861_07883 [Colletotrichum tofieldiae]